MAAGGTEPERGALVTVVDSRRIPLGTGLYSSASQIAVRMVSRTADLGRGAYLDGVRERVRAAAALRDALQPWTAENNARRLVFSEADGLPGIVVDQYNDLMVLQLLTQGTAQNDVRAVLVEELGGQFGEGGGTLWERPDPKMRELEELVPAPPGPLYRAGEGEALTTTVFTINGVRFAFDVGAGQKTGAFLDQRLNYQAAADWLRRSGLTGQALDVCTYQGGFALHLARVCARVTGVDQSRAALEAAERNLGLNKGLRGEVDWIEADAFALLRALEAGEGGGMGLPERFDAIVLDPPAFAKSKRAVDGALRGYKEMNLRAMHLLSPGGTLVTCSCSHHVGLEGFWGAVAEAAADAGRRVQVLETRAAAPDHPEVVTLPETRYLKCLICRLE